MKPSNKSSETETRKSFSRPKDESLQAYKDWINGLVQTLNPNDKSSMTEGEWEAMWREFWSEANQDDKK